MKTNTPVENKTVGPRPMKTATKEQKEILHRMASAVKKADRGEKISTLHMMTIKHSTELSNVTAKEFGVITKLPKAYGIEFVRIHNISDRLIQAGVDEVRTPI